MNTPELDVAFTELRRQSLLSLALMMLGVLFVLGSVGYAVTRLRPLEEQIAEKQAVVQRLADEEARQHQNIAELQQQYATLKANIEKLYAVRVTPQNQVYELKASAQATGGLIGGSRPEYRFELYVNSPPETLKTIKAVTYRFDHPTFEQKEFVSDNVTNRFMVSYVGWGCLRRVGVSVALVDGTIYPFNFDFCRSLGPQWGSRIPTKSDPLPAPDKTSTPVVTSAPAPKPEQYRSPPTQTALPDATGRYPNSKLSPTAEATAEALARRAAQLAIPDKTTAYPISKLPPARETVPEKYPEKYEYPNRIAVPEKEADKTPVPR